MQGDMVFPSAENVESHDLDLLKWRPSENSRLKNAHKRGPWMCDSGAQFLSNSAMCPAHFSRVDFSSRQHHWEAGVLKDARPGSDTYYILTRGARSGILAELILGMRSRASLAPRFCTSVYLKGNPWPLGTEIYVLVPGGSLGSVG